MKDLSGAAHKSIRNPEQDFDVMILVDDIRSLQKSDGSKNSRHVYGEASNNSLDLEGDMVDAAGVRASMDFWKHHGKLDWCHKGALDPKFLAGEPVGWDQIDGRLCIEASLYDDWPISDDIWGILQRKGKLGYSLGGKILKTRPVFSKEFGGMVKMVQKVFVNHVAVTPFPVNYNTSVTTVPWKGFMKMLDPSIVGKLSGAGEKEFKKMMDTVSGSALLTESLEHSGDKEIKQALMNMIGKMRGGGILPDKYFAKSGRFHSPRHAHGYLVKCQKLPPAKADLLLDYLILRRNDIASIL